MKNFLIIPFFIPKYINGTADLNKTHNVFRIWNSNPEWPEIHKKNSRYTGDAHF